MVCVYTKPPTAPCENALSTFPRSLLSPRAAKPPKPSSRDTHTAGRAAPSPARTRNAARSATMLGRIGCSSPRGRRLCRQRAFLLPQKALPGGWGWPPLPPCAAGFTSRSICQPATALMPPGNPARPICAFVTARSSCMSWSRPPRLPLRVGRGPGYRRDCRGQRRHDLLRRSHQSRQAARQAAARPAAKEGHEER